MQSICILDLAWCMTSSSLCFSMVMRCVCTRCAGIRLTQQGSSLGVQTDMRMLLVLIYNTVSCLSPSFSTDLKRCLSVHMLPCWF